MAQIAEEFLVNYVDSPIASYTDCKTVWGVSRDHLRTDCSAKCLYGSIYRDIVADGIAVAPSIHVYSHQSVDSVPEAERLLVFVTILFCIIASTRAAQPPL